MDSMHSFSSKARNQVTHSQKTTTTSTNGVKPGGLVVLTTNIKVKILKFRSLLVEYASLMSPSNGETGMVVFF